MKYISLCSGIESASVAWKPLGWTPVAFAEIEKFPSAVLAHRYPNVPNLGDMTQIDGSLWRGSVDLVVGGTPCQAFSIAGMRKSLDDDRGNLTLHFVELCNEIQPSIIVWENVPGVLNTKDNAFGCFLGALAGESEALVPPGKRWPDAGYVVGPERIIAWRILDAQYFKLAQRRKRVFVVASPRNGIDPREILFESEGMPGHTPACVETRKAASRRIIRGVVDSSVWEQIARRYGTRTEAGAASAQVGFEVGPGQEGYIDVCPKLDTRCKDGPIRNQLGIGVMHVADTTTTLGASFGSKLGLENQHIDSGATLFVTAFSAKDYGADATNDLCPTLRAGNSDTSHANSGNWMAVAIHPHCIGRAPAAGPQGKEYLDDGSAYTMDGRGVSQAVAVSLRGREGGATAELSGDVSPAIRTGGGGGDKPHVLAFHENQRGEITTNETAGSLKSGGGKPGQGYPAIQKGMTVRRLTPTECERLQGFPDNYTNVPYRNKPAADGPRYKALGNSMAVPCMAWIGKRIELCRK